ncbi:MAG: hypothetical protein L6461_02705 [Anaerolineae bacterium]|nr:hypothetical protein [Anaerolineae bacterium]
MGNARFCGTGGCSAESELGGFAKYKGKVNNGRYVFVHAAWLEKCLETKNHLAFQRTTYF